MKKNASGNHLLTHLDVADDCTEKQVLRFAAKSAYTHELRTFSLNTPGQDIACQYMLNIAI